MKKLLLLALWVMLAVPAMAVPRVTVSLGAPIVAGPSPTVDGWWIPVLIENQLQADVAYWGPSSNKTGYYRNIHFGGNVKPVLHCAPNPFVPWIVCGATIGDGSRPYHLMQAGNFWPHGFEQFPPYDQPTLGGISPGTYIEPDTAYMALEFRHNSNLGPGSPCAAPLPLSAELGRFRVVLRYPTADIGTITLAPWHQEEGFSSSWWSCLDEEFESGVGPPITVYHPTPPEPGGGGGACGGDPNCIEGLGATLEGKPAPQARKRVTWGTLKAHYR